MAWYTKELKKYARRTEEEKEQERRKDEQWWRNFLRYSPINYGRRNHHK